MISHGPVTYLFSRHGCVWGFAREGRDGRIRRRGDPGFAHDRIGAHTLGHLARRERPAALRPQVCGHRAPPARDIVRLARRRETVQVCIVPFHLAKRAINSFLSALNRVVLRLFEIRHIRVGVVFLLWQHFFGENKKVLLCVSFMPCKLWSTLLLTAVEMHKMYWRMCFFYSLCTVLEKKDYLYMIGFQADTCAGN